MRIVEIDECRRHSINEDAVARARISVAHDFMTMNSASNSNDTCRRSSSHQRDFAFHSARSNVVAFCI